MPRSHPNRRPERGDFEHHLIGRIAQERPPHEMALDRLDHGEHRRPRMPMSNYMIADRTHDLI
jgi:hypothetical protein